MNPEEIALVEDSTIAHNGADGAGGILNRGALVVRNSSIIFNASGGSGPGAGIRNGGYLEIVNSTIAKNSLSAFFGRGGGGISNFGGGFASITNSTIRENQVIGLGGPGGGISNTGGTVRIQNTIVAGNTSVFLGSLVPRTAVGMITSLGNNLVGDPSGCDINLQPTDLTGDPGLGALVGTGEDDLPGRALLSGLGRESSYRQGKSDCLSTNGSARKFPCRRLRHWRG